jgi:hypothetical protein
MPASDWYSDTDPQALEVFLRLQREMSADQKIAAVFQMTCSRYCRIRTASFNSSAAEC